MFIQGCTKDCLLIDKHVKRRRNNFMPFNNYSASDQHYLPRNWSTQEFEEEEAKLIYFDSK